MKRAVVWAFIVPVLIFACTSTEPVDLDPLDAPDAASDASSPPDADADGGETAAACGDRTLDANEQCDDGNNNSADGCSADCKIESSGPGDTCPGAPIALTGSGTSYVGSVTATTSTAYAHYAGSCGGASEKDAVYVVTPEIDGILTAKLTSALAVRLYARRACDDAKTEVLCKELFGRPSDEPVSVPVTKGQSIYLFVDEVLGRSGQFKLDVEVAAPTCGDGFAQPPEVCDDGNVLPGDGCAADCSLEEGGFLRDCPGQGITLSGPVGVSRKVSFAGATTGQGPGLLGQNCASSGPNMIYAIASDIDGSLTAKLVAGYEQATLHIRTECKDATTQLDCVEGTQSLQGIEVTVPVRVGLRHYVVVDGAATSGPYTLDVVVTPAQCGNGVLDGGEVCDDGNVAAGDGCAPDCSLEPVDAASDNCPGLALPLSLGADGKYARIITSSTAVLSSNLKAKSSPCNQNNAGKDAVYLVTPPVTGRLFVSVQGSFDTMLYVRNACSTDPSTYVDLVCESNRDGNLAEFASLPAVANTPLWVVVDGELSTSAGVFDLNVVLTPAVCGNSVLDGGETCDDGNAASGDGCSDTCQIEPVTGHDTCANAEAIALSAAGGGSYAATITSGTTNLAHDQTFSTACASAGRDAIFTVVAPVDGVLTASVPTANFNVSLGARATCTGPTTAIPLTCSNRSSDRGDEEIVLSVVQGQTYYVIVDGTAAGEFGTFTMNLALQPAGCSDGIVSGAETCDDGNLTDGDGCSKTCAVEPLPGIDSCPGYALALVGAGAAPRTATLTVDTSTLAATYAGGCGGSSSEGVVVVTPDIAGKLTARLTGQTYKPVLYARTTCNDAATEKACSIDAQATIGSTREIVIAAVVAGTPYYLFVDGFNGTAGVGRLTVTVTP